MNKVRVPSYSRVLPCGNAMIDAPVENLMDNKVAHRFTTSAWKSLRLSHNPLDKCFAFTHIPTRPTTTNLICQKTKPKRDISIKLKRGHFKRVLTSPKKMVASKTIKSYDTTRHPTREFWNQNVFLKP